MLTGTATRRVRRHPPRAVPVTAHAPPTSRDLGCLFDPRAVAVVGASDDVRKYGNWLARRALAARKPAYLVNPMRDEVLGKPAWPSLQAVPGPVDMAVLAVPAHGFAQAVDDALAAGVKVIVGVTSGLGELGGEQLRHQRAIVERVRNAGARLLGPNCLGVIDHSTGLDACINAFPVGHVALISQSGNLALDIGTRLGSYQMGVSRFASIGNQADITVEDLVESCSTDEQTAAIGLYCEGFADGRAFVAAAAKAAEAGRPVVVLTVGRSSASARGAASHTGSMVTSEEVVSAACKTAGAELVRTPAELVDLLQAITRTSRPGGDRVAVFADGGGHAAIAADALESRGLRVPPLSSALQHKVAAYLPSYAGTSNPIDVAGAGEKDLGSFSAVAATLLPAPEVDAVVMSGYFGGYREYGNELAAQEMVVAHNLAEDVRARKGCLLVQSMYPDSPAIQAMRSAGVAVYRDIEQVAWVLSRLARRSDVTQHTVLELPPPAPPVTTTGYWPSRRMLMAAGVPFADAVEVTTLDDLAVAAASLRFPLALKALGNEHKSDTGGVLLGIESPAELAEKWTELHSRLSPPSCSLEEMAPLGDAVELIVGARNDPSFGTVVLVGLGGLYTEVMHDVRSALGPIDHASATKLLRDLDGAALLDGFRGRPAVAIDRAAEVVVAISRFAAAHPEVTEVECNPVAVTPTSAIALDSRIILKAPTEPRGS